MIKNLTYFFVFSIFFVTAIPMLHARAEFPALPQTDFSALRYMGVHKVTRVIDPQTVQFADGRLVRLASLDIPDYDPHDPGPLSITSMQVLGDMLVGKDINFYQTKKKDWGRSNRMGHEIGHIQRRSDEAWVQGTLLRLGLARVRTTKRNPELAPAMYAMEQAARAESIGLWEVDEHKILTPEQAKDRTGKFQIVEGTIESVSLNKNRLYINFGLNWKNDFTVSVPPSDKRAFSKQGLDPLQWNGKTVRVRGWLESYNGPYIEIDHPERIEDLSLDKNP